MDRTPFPAFEDDDTPPPTMRSPESTLRVRDHVVAVEVHPPRPPVRRAKLPSSSGLFAIAPITTRSRGARDDDPPTRHDRVA